VAYRKYIDEYFERYGEVFPIGFSEGYKLHDSYGSKKYKELKIRRVKLRNGEVYSIIPSDYMPYLIGKTEDVSKGLLLRHWAVPYEVIAKVLGRDAMYWARAEEGLGRISIVGSLCKTGELPDHVAADEKITWFNGKEAYVALTSSRDCVLGADLSMSEDTRGLEESYGVFKSEVLDCDANYAPKSVNLDGWKATNAAWASLFENISIILCFLHGYLKIKDVGRSMKEKFHLLGNEIWNAYRSKTKAEFHAALENLMLWAGSNIADYQKVVEKVKDLCGKATRFSKAYEHEGAYRTSNQIDRPMNILDRYLYQIRYFHGNHKTANLKVRAWAIIYNFMPFCKKTQKLKKQSRFEEYNHFVYHQNWLHNAIIAGSMNGYRTRHKKQ
jgi:hypothetical protein